MTQLACPTCRKPAAPRPQNPRFPFCCERCRLIDLGRWLGEEYRVPDETSAVAMPASDDD